MFICPNCGEPVRDDAPACPHCGSDDETGWNPDADYLSVDLPEEDDRYRPAGKTAAGGDYSVFAYFLIAVGVLGLVALGVRGGRGGSFFWPGSLIAVFALITGILISVRRRSRP